MTEMAGAGRGARNRGNQVLFPRRRRRRSQRSFADHGGGSQKTPGTTLRPSTGNA